MFWRTACLFLMVHAWLAGATMATMIDSFSEGEQGLRVTAGTPNVFDQASGPELGGFRDVALHLGAGPVAYADVLIDPDGIFAFTQGNGEGWASITWDGTDSPGELSYGLDADLTAYGHAGLSIDIAGVSGNGMALRAIVYSDDEQASDYSFTVSEGTNGTVFLPYDGFQPLDGGAAADFLDVGAIVLEIDGRGHSGSDIALRAVGTAVPEPMAWWLMAIGAVGLACLARQRRKSYSQP